MGTAVSIAGDSVETRATSILSLFEYYVADAHVTLEDVHLAEETWRIITTNTSNEFFRVKEAHLVSAEPFLATSCLSWYFDTFFDYCVELDPNIKQSYGNDLRTQIRAMISMVSSSLTMYKNVDVAKVKLAAEKIAKSHCNRHVKVHQYPIVATVLIKTFHKCLGMDWIDQVTRVWSKIFSQLLDFIIPCVLKHESTVVDTETINSVRSKLNAADKSTQVVQAINPRQDSILIMLVSAEAEKLEEDLFNIKSYEASPLAVMTAEKQFFGENHSKGKDLSPLSSHTAATTLEFRDQLVKSLSKLESNEENRK